MLLGYNLVLRALSLILLNLVTPFGSLVTALTAIPQRDGELESSTMLFLLLSSVVSPHIDCTRTSTEEPAPEKASKISKVSSLMPR